MHAGEEQKGTHAAGRREAKRRARKEIDTYTYPVVVSAVDISGHTKVPNLYQQVLTHQTIPKLDSKNIVSNYKLSTEK